MSTPENIGQGKDKPPARHCSSCDTLMVHATGIGDYCPNLACHNVDGPAHEDQTGEAQGIPPTPAPLSDEAIGDEEETADLHAQWASDGDDLDKSFERLHAYAKRLEAALEEAYQPKKSLEGTAPAPAAPSESSQGQADAR